MYKVTPIRAFSDNYIWTIQREASAQVVLVDPGQSEPVLEYLQQYQLEPIAILITHQHYDHTGGVADLVKQYPYMHVIGPAIKPSKKRLSIDLEIPKLITYPVGEGDTVFLNELDLKFDVIAIPGHTLDHLAYLADGLVFCGDTLFAAGCGRLFSGTAEMMNTSFTRLAGLPPDTLLYCTHEYTVDNLGFAKWVEPDNPEIMQRDEEEMAKQEQGQPTLPTSVARELATNPFMRVKQPGVRAAAEEYAGHSLDEDWQVFAALREWKDTKYD